MRSWAIVYALVGLVTAKYYPTSNGMMPEKESGKQRFIAIGDSATFGLMSSNPDTKSWPAQYE